MDFGFVINSKGLQQFMAKMGTLLPSVLQLSTIRPILSYVEANTILDLLLMFVSYCVFELRCNIRSIPEIMSALRYAFVIKLVDCAPFYDPLLRTVKQGVANMPAPPHRVRMPYTLDIINHIIDINTTTTATINNSNNQRVRPWFIFSVYDLVNTFPKQSYRHH